MIGEWDYEWLADTRRGRVYEDGRGQIGEFDNEEDAKMAVYAVNAIRGLARPVRDASRAADCTKKEAA